MRFEPNWWPVPSLAGLLAAIDARPVWAFDRAALAAARCRALLASRAEVVDPGPCSTLVAFRPSGEPAELVEALFDLGVHVREIPRTGLLRASCGWWTSDDDLDRLVAALPA